MDEMQAAAADEGAIVESYRQTLRRVLARLGPDIAAIRDQLAAAGSELRGTGTTRSLIRGLGNLESLFALLDELSRGTGWSPLPKLDRFDAAVRGFVAELERLLGAGRSTDRLAERIEVMLLPALDGWGDVEAELTAAVETARPPLSVGVSTH